MCGTTIVKCLGRIGQLSRATSIIELVIMFRHLLSDTSVFFDSVRSTVICVGAFVASCGYVHSEVHLAPALGAYIGLIVASCGHNLIMLSERHMM
jgi:hypothetical protein